MFQEQLCARFVLFSHTTSNDGYRETEIRFGVEIFDEVTDMPMCIRLDFEGKHQDGQSRQILPRQKPTVLHPDEPREGQEIVVDPHERCDQQRRKRQQAPCICMECGRRWWDGTCLYPTTDGAERD